MQAVSPDHAGKIDVARDQEKYAAAPADRRITAGERRPLRVVIVAIEDGGALRQGAEDRLRIGNAPAIGEESERKRRFRAALFTRGAFERLRGRC